MARWFSISLMALILVSGCSAPTKLTTEAPVGQTPLTQAQIERYMNSYLPVHAMASAHWGKRQHTPPNRMLPPQGTFERAIEEMRAGGKLPDFQLLLQSHGFEDFDAWLRTGQRVSFAYQTLRQESRDPAGLILKRQARDSQLASIEKQREKLSAQSALSNKGQLDALDLMQNQLDRALLADMDAEALRPYFGQFEDLNKQVIDRER